jgi:hypothetical protein
MERESRVNGGDIIQSPAMFRRCPLEILAVEMDFEGTVAAYRRTFILLVNINRFEIVAH